MIFDSVENKRTTYCGLIDDKFLISLFVYMDGYTEEEIMVELFF